MATFYVLPPRECLEQAVAEFVGRTIPGLAVPPAACETLLAALAGDGVYFVHREDLAGADPVAELADGFGAEPGDVVLDVGLAPANKPAAVRRAVVPGVPAAAPAR